MITYQEALERAMEAMQGDAETIEALWQLRRRADRDDLISAGLKVEGPSAGVRGRADKGVLVEYMGVRVIIAARAEFARDRRVMVLLYANRPRDVGVTLEDWDPAMVVTEAANLAVLDALEDADVERSRAT